MRFMMIIFINHIFDLCYNKKLMMNISTTKFMVNGSIIVIHNTNPHQ